MRKAIIGGVLLIVAVAALAGFIDRKTGVQIDSYRGVAIYDNGPLLFKSRGRHYSSSGYYWGQKWQCVEFVKRFYDQAKNHQMPDVWGHARDFFESGAPQGGFNSRRGLLQFANGGDVMPVPDDLFVFSGGYGHVGIVSEVGSNFVEVVQQNIYRKPRQRFEMAATNGTFTVQSTRLMGWLRKK